MKRTESVETEYCDFCEVNPARYNHCLGCGKAICYDCQKTRAIEYKHGIHVGGSGDGLYCLECDARLLKAGDKLHAAYRLIKRLRDESEGFWAEFQQRAKEAEAALQRLLPKR